jgi:hypothetical protein
MCCFENISWGVIINSLGLFFDILGTCFLWKYSLSLFVKNEKGEYLFHTAYGEEIAKHVWGTKVGIGFLFSGFLLQMVGNFI